MKQKILKIVKWTAIIIFAIFFFFWFMGAYGYKIENYFMAQRQEKMRIESEKQIAEILEAQKNDNIGGKTPEETLDLYITALKAGDIELASKYYEVSVENHDLQKKDLESLKKIFNRDGNLNIVLKNMDNIIKSPLRKYFSESEYVITYKYLTEKNATSTMISGGTEYEWLVPKGEKESISKVLRLNPYTQVWKIIQ